MDLYRYDLATDELVDLSATPGGNGAQVLGVVGSDREAERVYYVAKGQVVPGEGTVGQANLYLWEEDGTGDGRTRFIASLLPDPEIFGNPDKGDRANWSDLTGDWTARTSPDGRYLLFQSKASIPGHEEGGLTQVYRYDAEANEAAGRLDCVSCNPEGEPPLGGSFVTRIAMNSVQLWELPRVLTADGRAFFTTRDDLLPADTNGKNDAYAWREGELELLSTGTSNRDSLFYNASLDGSDWFVLTGEALVPQDGDDLADLYTAHVNGGFASQFATPAPGCTGEECRSAGTEPPAGQPTTQGFTGPGNKTRPKARRCPKGKRRVKARNGKPRCVKRRSAKRNRANSNRRASR
jgi:hypothetical protein